MGYRARSATPGTVLCLASTILLALVSFNTPLLKSLYFLKATYTVGSNAGTVTFGTLGYCLEVGGQTTCKGPTVGYKLDLNAILGVSLFDIPNAIAKILTYVLIVHIVALGAGVSSVIFGLLSHFSGMGVLCFPTCTAAVTSSLALISLVIDLIVFYIAKARIDRVDGASASIGICVWLTLAAWLCAGFAGCAYGIGKCCVGARKSQPSGDPEAESSYNKRRFDKSDGEHWRMQALAAEQARKKETGLPSFPDYERTPLTAREDEDAKYLQEEPAPLRRDGSVINNVGVGYGRKTPTQPAWQTQDPYAGSGSQAGYGSRRTPSMRSQTTSAGEFAGIGAGAGAAAAAAGYNAHQQQQQQLQQSQYSHYDDYYDHSQPQTLYQDPYAAQAQQSYADPYSNPQQSNYDAYERQEAYHQESYPAQPQQQQQGYADPYNGYGQTPIPVPSPVQQRPVSDAYDAIGVSATTAGAGQHARDYTGTELQNPRPQHLHQQQAAADLLAPTSPISPVDTGPSPPSYGDVPAQQVPNEKARYR